MEATASINFLAVPNAFLSHSSTTSPFGNIGGSVNRSQVVSKEGCAFSRRATLLEKEKAKEEKYFHLAMKEFETLYRTPGAPLEYSANRWSMNRSTM